MKFCPIVLYINTYYIVFLPVFRGGHKRSFQLPVQLPLCAKKFAFSITIGFNYTFHTSLYDIFCRSLGVDTRVEV